MESVSLHGIFNPLEIETILNKLILKINIQDNTIKILESKIATKNELVELEELIKYNNELINNNITVLIKKVEKIEIELKEIEKYKNIGNDNNIKLEKLENSSILLESNILNNNDKIKKLDSILLNIDTDISKIKNLESCYQLTNDNIQLINLSLNNKMDKLEIPLIKMANDTIKKSNDYCSILSNKLEECENTINLLKSQIAIKEDKDTMVLRMQKIAEQLSTKTDNFQFTELQNALNIASEQQTTIVKNLSSSFETGSFSTVLTDLKSLQTTVEQLAQNVTKKADLTNIVTQQQQTESFAMLAKEVSNEINSLHSILGSLSNSFSTMQNTFVSLDSRVNTCVKFVDWFAECGEKTKLPSGIIRG